MRQSIVAILIVAFTTWASIASAAAGRSLAENVAAAQVLLVRLGYDPGSIDGVPGKRTIEAIREFYAANDINLEPAEIEPQISNVVETLTAAFGDRLMQPSPVIASRYHAALAGDVNAANDLAFMYLQGNSVRADPMLAYLWWIKAETHGKTGVGNLKQWLRSSGKISEHEIDCARALANYISDAQR